MNGVVASDEVWTISEFGIREGNIVVVSMQDTHPKIHDMESEEWEEEVRMIRQGAMNPSAEVIKMNGTSSVRDGQEASGGRGVFLRDGIVENFVPRRQRQQRTGTDSMTSERREVSQENDRLLGEMTDEQIVGMQEELKEALTPETIAWFKRREQ